MADSIGKQKNNLALSRKRANNTAKYLQATFQTMPPYKTYALGERYDIQPKENQQHRKVQIIIHAKPQTPEEEETIPANDTIKFCSYADYELLHRSNITQVIKNKKKYISIQTNFLNPYRENKYYYATTKNGQLYYTKIKWKFVNTGRNWWANRRHTTLIPKHAYDYHRIFTQQQTPCTNCGQVITPNTPINNIDTTLQADYFLMSNLQVKFSIFNRRTVKIRAPREYVNPTSKYFIGCSKQQLFWTTRSGRKNKNYYFTTLPASRFYLYNIVRITERCNQTPYPSSCGTPIIPVICAYNPDRNPTLGLEAGTYYTPNAPTPYAGIAIWKNTHTRTGTIMFGADKDLAFYATLKVQRSILVYPLGKLKAVVGWQSPGKAYNIKYAGMLYGGTETRVRIKTPDNNIAEQNLHIGFAIADAGYNKRISKIYIQAAAAYNFLKPEAGSYGVYTFGINYRITNLTRGLEIEDNDRM